MKVEEVPQDKGFLIEGRISDLNYAVDKNGQYTSTQSKGWAPKNDAMNMAWDVVFERASEARKKILEGKLSPLAFYMELNIMDTAILSGYTGIPKWKVKRHLKMKNFSKLRPDVLAKYAEALKLTPDELVDLNKIREVKLEHEN
jgi:hypothetical protein